MANYAFPICLLNAWFSHGLEVVILKVDWTKNSFLEPTV